MNTIPGITNLPLRFVIVILACLIYCSIVSNPVLAVQGQSGAPGESGDPGTDGGDGGDGANRTSFASVFGSDGGAGGWGGAGVDGEDEDLIASGGDAGNGGNGGATNVNRVGRAALAPFPILSFAAGGDGGAAGRVGQGTDPSLDGVGGDGGAGGNAFAKATRDSYEGSFRGFLNDLTVTSVGGDGGDAYGIDGQGGDGGAALTQAIISHDWSVVNYPRIKLQQFGGNGGVGYSGAAGGTGASVSYGFGFENFSYGSHVDGLGSRRTTLTGIGGNGGHSYGGVAGKAGNAVVDMLGVSAMLESRPRVVSDTFIKLTGGAGGKGFADGMESISGTAGGHALMTNQSVFSGVNADIYFFVELAGGNGGSAHGHQNLGNGGNGGTASLAPVFINVAQPVGLPVSNFGGRAVFAADLRGGDGGNAFGSGRGGDGAAVDYSNSVSMLASDNRSAVNIRGFGGDGGWGKTENGNGGNAVVQVNQPIVYQNSRAPEGTRKATARATGGNSGLGQQATNQADGGDAFAVAIQSTFLRAVSSASSLGGLGNLGRNGDATAIAEAHSNGAPIDVPGNYNSLAVATAAPVTEEYHRYNPAIGTNSNARAVSSTQAGSLANAQAIADGGWGTELSGNAFSHAIAHNYSDRGDAKSLARSQVYTDKNPNSENVARSTAYSESHSRDHFSESDASAKSNGHFSSSHARATSRGFNVSNTASVSNSTQSWMHISNLRSSASSTDNDNESLELLSSAHGGFRQSQIEFTADYDSFMHMLVIPDQGVANAILANSGLGDVFVDDADANILAIGSLGGRAGALSGESAKVEISNSFDLVLAVEDFYADKNLMIGFFGATSTGNGFDEMFLDLHSGSDSIFEATFSSLQEADDFFADALFDYGAMNALGDNFRLQLDVDLTLADAADSYEFEFVVGNADPRNGGSGNFSSVPEPASGLLLGLGMLALVARRRR